VLRLLGLLLFIAVTAHANGASFDCTAASSYAEITVCSDLLLSEIDENLADVYSVAANLTNRRTIRRQHVEWLERRNACTDTGCIKAAYDVRLAQLNRLISARRDAPDAAEGDSTDALNDDRCGGRSGARALPCKQPAWAAIRRRMDASFVDLRKELNRGAMPEQASALVQEQIQWGRNTGVKCEQRGIDEAWSSQWRLLYLSECVAAEQERRTAALQKRLKQLQQVK
jgi:uncharacterized protein YecT (DUF1311 family)